MSVHLAFSSITEAHRCHSFVNSGMARRPSRPPSPQSPNRNLDLPLAGLLSLLLASLRIFPYHRHLSGGTRVRRTERDDDLL
ncbi:unnamed protein product [Spirodela intermedia]|uniref:Uncharacterized protein n=1 Tax=Spirodela intermedia TaxID=51605 RepID=A0A7I8JRW9_SPIIN|nr:unnamed protein product [Spirodela intermedia]CAA6672957.1 unnamed protein product [Spirodela intermedia]